MTPSLSPPVSQDPTCRVCSKPIRSGFIQTATGELVHVRCRSDQLLVRGLELRERGRLAIERVADLVEERRRRNFAQPIPTRRPACCPVCARPATLTDWRPRLDWLTVEECHCRGFFIWTPLLDEGRLVRLTPKDREIVSERIRHLRAAQSEVWLTTRDGTLNGALIIRTVRPDRPT
jgi:hypothetical protein